MIVEFVCLANSFKEGERCVAGIRLDNDAWIRPVSTREGGAVGPKYHRYQGSDIRLLQVVRANLTPCPLPNQPENWLIGGGDWEIAGALSDEPALKLIEPRLVAGPSLLGSVSDRIPYVADAPPTVDGSLVLVEPQNLRWTLAERPSRSTLQKRAIFELAGQTYNLGVTDPVWVRKLEGLEPHLEHPSSADGYPASVRRFFTISLGGEFQGACYKLVSGVIAIL